MPPENILGKPLTHARIVFSDNQRSKHVRHQKSGKISGGKLYRAAVDDPRLFQKKIMPGKKDYFFVIMGDISGSNMSGTIEDLKRMLLVQGELLSRLGVKFEMYAHTAMAKNLHSRAWDPDEMYLDIYTIKDGNEAWTEESRLRVAALSPAQANLDGHALEFARKRCDAAQATRKIILYSSDGAMPAENFREELDILQNEIALCKKKKYILAGVGLRTDSPSRHGLETVQVNSAADIGLVVRQLEKYLN
jgi:cobalamin biosynthesis protein CobT